MNPRYTIFTHESLCNASGVPAAPSSVQEEQRIDLNSNSRLLRSSNLSSSSLPSSPPFLIRLAMKISRSRWYSFLRRVFHYQNGSGSELGPNPFDTVGWMLIEFMALVVQILVTVYTLTISRDERPVWPMRIWLSGYAFGCFLSLIILVWRYLQTHRFPPGESVDIEQQGSREESRTRQHMQRCRATVELLFAIWFVMGNVWVFDTRFGSYRQAPKLHILCISLLAWNAVTYSFPFIIFVLLCCCVPILSSLLGYNMNAASIQRGATEEQLARLPSWKFKDGAECVLDMEKPAKNREDPECCICLNKYREKEEIRQLPCDHIFHQRCVDQWLRIISCCPLCKQDIHK